MSAEQSTNLADIAARFRTHIAPPDEHGCEIWLGYVRPCGAGGFPAFSTSLAHRVAWILAHGEIPAGANVHHSCDNRACVAVAHLYLGSAEKGRKALSPVAKLAKFTGLPNEHGCVEYQGTRNASGYGVISGRAGENHKLAHRVAWEAVHGPIPDGLNCLHRCDNPPCVSVPHLFLGTHRDNSHDARSKGRNFVPPPMEGSSNPAAKLTEAGVADMRRQYASGARQVDLCRQFGVSQAVVSDAVLRKTWRHVP